MSGAGVRLLAPESRFAGAMIQGGLPIPRPDRVSVPRRRIVERWRDIHLPAAGHLVFVRPSTGRVASEDASAEGARTGSD